MSAISNTWVESFLRPLVHFVRVNRSYRRVITDLVKRDFRVRYLGSVMGGLWNLIHPLAMITIYTVVFSKVMHARAGMNSNGEQLDYTIYLCSALLPWNALVETISRGTRTFLDNSGLIKKVAFPMDILHTVVAGSATMTFLIAYTLFIGFALILGHAITWHFLLIPIVYLFQLLFALGIAMFLSILNVFYRDIEQGVGIVFQIWFWVTPIMYTEGNTPKAFSYFLRFNPLYYFTETYHQLTFFHQLPAPHILWTCFFLGAGVFWFGTVFMSRYKLEVPDEL